MGKIVVADLLSTNSFICPQLVKKTPNLGKKSQTSNKQVQYTFDVAKIAEIFDFLLKEKCSTFPLDHQLHHQRETRGKSII